jgi:hypothetical protein
MYFNRPLEYVRLEAERGHLWVHRKWGEDLNRVVRYVGEHTGDSDPILVIPAEAYVYFLSMRKNPTKHLAFHKGELTPAKQLEAIKSLEEKKPKLVIFGGIFKLEFIEYYTSILSYIYDHYQLAEKIGKYEVYARKPYGH